MELTTETAAFGVITDAQVQYLQNSGSLVQLEGFCVRVGGGNLTKDSLARTLTATLSPTALREWRIMNEAAEVEANLLAFGRYFATKMPAADAATPMSHNDCKRLLLDLRLGRDAAPGFMADVYAAGGQHWPPSLVLSLSSFITCTSACPCLQRLLQRLGVPEVAALVPALRTVLSNAALLAMPVEVLAPAMEATFNDKTGCAAWDDPTWRAHATSALTVGALVGRLAAGVGGPGLGAVPPPPPSPAKNSVDFKFNPDAKSVSYSTYLDLATGGPNPPQSEANKQASALTKNDPVDIVIALNEPAIASSVAQALASGGKTGIGPSTVANGLLATRTGVDRLWGELWGESDQKQAALLELFPDIPKHIRQGKLSAIKFPEIIRLLRDSYDFKHSALQFSKADSGCLLPLDHHTSNEICRMFDPVIPAGATGKDAVTLFGSFIQEQGALRAHRDRIQLLQLRGARDLTIRDFCRRVERDFEDRFAEWASGETTCGKPLLAVLPPALQLEFDDSVRLLRTVDDYKRILRESALGGELAQPSAEVKSLRLQVAAMEKSLAALTTAAGQTAGVETKTQRRNRSVPPLPALHTAPVT